MSRIAAFLIAALVFTAPAAAQDIAYEPQDAMALQQCLEAVRDINADPKKDQPASRRDCIGVAAEACQQESPEMMSTIGMMECALRENAWWDEQLNVYYADLRDRLEPEVFDKLQEAQRTWIAYRDADCAFIWEMWREGTIRTILHASCLLEATAQRAIELGGTLDELDLR